MEIIAVTGEPGITLVRALFQEYWDTFGFTPCFQNFGDELAGLPGKYSPPSGRLAVAYVDGEPAGCVALRRIDDQRCEAKRLYVQSRFRGQGIGRTLLKWVIAEARAAGYREMLGDTMPVMQNALAMYERMGFERTEPYSGEPTPGAIYIRLSLESF
jgi:GNAT superfamily N-acetyltransferase